VVWGIIQRFLILEFDFEPQSMKLTEPNASVASRRPSLVGKPSAQ
jgi:hypothetical protein